MFGSRKMLGGRGAGRDEYFFENVFIINLMQHYVGYVGYLGNRNEGIILFIRAASQFRHNNHLGEIEFLRILADLRYEIIYRK